MWDTATQICKKSLNSDIQCSFNSMVNCITSKYNLIQRRYHNDIQLICRVQALKIVKQYLDIFLWGGGGEGGTPPGES